MHHLIKSGTSAAKRRLKAQLAALPLLALPLLAMAPPAKADNMRDIARKGEFEICVNPRAMPLSDLLEAEAGRQPGIQIDIGKELAKRLKVSLKTSWLSYRYLAKYTNCDAFLGVARLKGEPDNQYLKKTIPFFKVELLLATRPGTTIAIADELTGKRIAVDNGSLVHDQLREKGGAEIFVSYTTDEKKLDALLNNEVDVALVSNLGLGWYKKTHPQAAINTSSSKLIAETYEYDYAFGLRRADRMTARDFNDIITAMIEDGSFKKIFESYGIDYKVNKFEGEYIR